MEIVFTLVFIGLIVIMIGIYASHKKDQEEERLRKIRSDELHARLKDINDRVNKNVLLREQRRRFEETQFITPTVRYTGKPYPVKSNTEDLVNNIDSIVDNINNLPIRTAAASSYEAPSHSHSSYSDHGSSSHSSHSHDHSSSSSSYDSGSSYSDSGSSSSSSDGGGGW